MEYDEPIVLKFLRNFEMEDPLNDIVQKDLKCVICF